EGPGSRSTNEGVSRERNAPLKQSIWDTQSVAARPNSAVPPPIRSTKKGLAVAYPIAVRALHDLAHLANHRGIGEATSIGEPTIGRQHQVVSLKGMEGEGVRGYEAIAAHVRTLAAVAPDGCVVVEFVAVALSRLQAA